MRYIQRTMETTLKRAVKEFPAAVLTGPRQSGKTTLLHHLYSKTHRYVSLDPTDIRALAANDPRGFLEINAPPVIFDEIQNLPQLLPYIKERIDARRNVKGQYILTGSQNLLLLESVTETLAGRTAVLKLLPMTRREIDGFPGKPLPWEKGKKPSGRTLSHADLWNRIVKGSYPEIVANPKSDSVLWLSAYMITYFERDVRSLRNIGDLTLFQNFLRVLAVRSGQLLSLSDISRDIGVAVNTVKKWISILEATHQILILRPYFTNIGKRLVKSPKVYFTDTGILCHLTGIKDPEHASQGPMAGALFETYVFLEIYKTMLHRGVEPRIYFWRTSDGKEVDFIIDQKLHLIPIEAKLTATPKSSDAKGIETFKTLFKERCAPGYIVHPGATQTKVATEISFLPFSFL